MNKNENFDKKELKGGISTNLIIASHASLAQGTVDTIRLLANRQDVQAINAYETSKSLEDLINEVYQQIDPAQKTIIFTDLLGGSVNQAIVRQLYDKGVYIIAGFNLALILECLTLKEEEVTETKINEIIDCARNEMVLVNTLLSKGGRKK